MASPNPDAVDGSDTVREEAADERRGFWKRHRDKRPGPEAVGSAGLQSSYVDPEVPLSFFPQLRINERDLDARWREVRLEGQLDLSVADRFKERLDAAAVDDVDVLVRLDDCDFIDSTGIAVIVLAHRLMAKQGRRLVVCRPSAEVGRILALTGLTDEGIVFDSAEAVLAERSRR